MAKFYSSVNQALKLSEVTYGEMKYWDDLTSGTGVDEQGKSASNSLIWFNKYLKPNLKYVKINSDSSGRVIVYFADGSAMQFWYESVTFYPDAKTYKAVGNSYDKTYEGTKAFVFLWAANKTAWQWDYHKGKGIEPYLFGWDGNESTLKTNATYGCNLNATAGHCYCTALISRNGWKIPDDYPFKF